MYIFQLFLHFFVTPVLSSVQLIVEISFPFIIICYGAVSLLFELKHILNLKPFLELPYLYTQWQIGQFLRNTGLQYSILALFLLFSTVGEVWHIYHLKPDFHLF